MVAIVIGIAVLSRLVSKREATGLASDCDVKMETE